MGFVKLDEGVIYSSLMCEGDAVFKIFMILLATCSRDGISPLSISIIMRLCSKTREEVVKCLTILESPDENSRSKNDEGRRIEIIDGGFFVINHKKYREFDYSTKAEAVRKRKYRHRNDKKKDGTVVGRVPDKSRHSVYASASEEGKSAEKGTAKEVLPLGDMEKMSDILKKVVGDE